MFLKFMRPEVFDALVIASVVIGLAIAWRRFRLDLRKPLPEDAPDWARARYESSNASSTSSES